MTQTSYPADLLGATARWTAAVRAKENERENRLFSDPWAALLANQQGAAWIEARSEKSIQPMLLRTRYFDDFLQRITLENAIRQIVLMAAGMDTRAFRLSWPEHTQVFELDQSNVLQAKEQILRSAGAQPACSRRTIGVDLTASWKEDLLEAGFQPLQPSGWLLEGFLFYLPNHVGAHLIQEITSLSKAGSWIGFDIINSTMMTSEFSREWVEMQAKSGAPWIGTMDDPQGFLASLGWDAALTQAGQPDANYGRWTFPVYPTLMPNMPHNWFVTARRCAPSPN